MPTTQSITVDLEHARMMQEVGWPQDEPLHVWFRITADGDWRCRHQYSGQGGRAADDYMFEHGHAFAAPTAEEILRRLPVRLDGGYPIAVFRDHRGWCVHYRDEMQFTDDTLSNAAAAMYCHLSKSNLLPLP